MHLMIRHFILANGILGNGRPTCEGSQYDPRASRSAVKWKVLLIACCGLDVHF